MPISELVDYIRTETQEGTPADALRVTLMETGWQEADIDNALHDVAAGLHPTTPGASIHEDLAQVRGMVAHLASRVKGLETTIASLSSVPAPQALPRQAELPSSFIGADHELSGPVHGNLFLKMCMVAVGLVATAAMAYSAVSLVSANALSVRDFLIITGALGALSLVVSIVLMRRGRSWGAALWSAAAIVLWVIDVVVAWLGYHRLEWSVAVALFVLLVVLSLVMSRWISRFNR